MKQSEKTRYLLIEHFKKHPLLQIQDIFKYLYQSSFGCEHMLSSLETVTDNIRKEKESASVSYGALADELDGEYCRVHLYYLEHGLSIQTLGKLFITSAKKEPDGLSELENKLNIAKELISEKALPFSLEEFEKAVEKWRTLGFQPIHHSDTFRENYKPSYRVISKKYLPFLPLMARIDKALNNGRVRVAINGGSASGKTTLSEMLSEIYDCTVFHMDDFFLRPEQRTPQRYAEVGGNIDRERFLSEVLIPLTKNDPISYRKFDCSSFTLSPFFTVVPKKLTVIEGAYSLHPELEDYYDISVFLDISPELQKKRINQRNSAQMSERFFNEWIPLEEIYFSKTETKSRSDISFKIEE